MTVWDASKHKNEPKVRVKFVGDPAMRGHGPDVLKSWGFAFPKGEVVEVPSSLAARLSKSDHFEVGDAIRNKPGRPPKVEAPASESA